MPPATDRRASAPMAGPPGFWTRQTLYAALMALMDAAALLAALLVGDLVAEWWYGGTISLRYSLLIVPAWWGGALFFRLLPGWGYGRFIELRRIGALLGLIYGAAAIALFLTRIAPAANRASYFISFLAAGITLPLGRSALRAVLSHSGLWGLPVDVFASTDRAAEIVRALESDRTFGYRVRAVRPAAGEAGGAPAAPEPRERPAVAIVAISAEGFGPDSAPFEALLAIYPSVWLVPDWPGAPTLWMEPRDLHGVLALAITNNLADPRARFVKRTLELAATLLAAPIWIPLTGALAVLVWAADRRAPFFRQPRIGRGGRPFRSWKLRTMIPDADRALEQRMRDDAALRDEWNSGFKLRDDPRVTRIGRALRRLSLDELPQLWNVLRGDMALVGPRPLPAYHHEQLSAEARRMREITPPGITGLWQVSGRSDSGMAAMERWDAYYVRNWSVALDLIILAKTLRAVLSRRGAY